MTPLGCKQTYEAIARTSGLERKFWISRFFTWMTSIDALYILWNFNFRWEKKLFDKNLMSWCEQDLGKHKPNRWVSELCRYKRILIVIHHHSTASSTDLYRPLNNGNYQFCWGWLRWKRAFWSPFPFVTPSKSNADPLISEGPAIWWTLAPCSGNHRLVLIRARHFVPKRKSFGKYPMNPSLKILQAFRVIFVALGIITSIALLFRSEWTQHE